MDEFAVTTNDGLPVQADGPTLEIEGTAPIQVATILMVRNDEDPVPVVPRWTRTTEWALEVDTSDESQTFEFLGFDEGGELIGLASFVVTSEQTFLRGDSNSDENVNLSDAVATLFYLFGSQELLCLDAADADDNGQIEITDAIAVLGYLFQGDDPLPAPFPDRGIDTTKDELDCAGP